MSECIEVTAGRVVKGGRVASPIECLSFNIQILGMCVHYPIPT